MTDRLHIIDPPVTPYSSKAEIQAWLRELKAIPDPDDNVYDAIEQAERWLKQQDDNAS